MNTKPNHLTLRKGGLVTTAVLTISFVNGCAAINQHIAGLSNAALIKLQTHQDLANIRQDTREALAKQEEEARRTAAERDIQEAKIAAERQRLEVEFCRANQEELQRRIKENVRETVESKVAFNLQQGMEVGELEVDVEELKRVIDNHDKEPLTKTTPPKQPCACCDKVCGCGENLTRRNCPRCCKKPCEAEKKCGGEEALTKLEQQPLKKPIRPTEIPMKLPVRLTFGFQRPEMEAVRIRRTPNLPPEELKRPCDRCGNGQCQCDVPCTDGSAGHTVHVAPNEDGDTVPTSEKTPWPQPEPDLGASRIPRREPGWPADASRDSKASTDSIVFASKRKVQVPSTKRIALQK